MTGTDPIHLFVVAYADDAERKRVEYLFNNLPDGEIETPEGLVRIVSGGDHEAIYEELVSKVPPDQIRSYELAPADADVDPETVHVERMVDAPRDVVEPFVEYMLSKKKAVLQSAAHDEYEVYTKKGRAEVRYDLVEDGGTTTVSIRITGYAPAPSFLAEFFETELADYSRTQA
jgi:hypothetical protein